MAKTTETFRKRQRERQVREKAEQKRMQREQRRTEKKLSQPELESDLAAPPSAEEPVAGDRDPAGETLPPEEN